MDLGHLPAMAAFRSALGYPEYGVAGTCEYHECTIHKNIVVNVFVAQSMQWPSLWYSRSVSLASR